MYLHTYMLATTHFRVSTSIHCLKQHEAREPSTDTKIGSNRPSLEIGSYQLIVALYTLSSIYRPPVRENNCPEKLNPECRPIPIQMNSSIHDDQNIILTETPFFLTRQKLIILIWNLKLIWFIVEFRLFYYFYKKNLKQKRSCLKTVFFYNPKMIDNLF